MDTNVRTPDLELVKQTVLNKFADLRGALQMREKLLLRQIEVIEQQQIVRSNKASKTALTFIPHQEEELLSEIRRYGRFQMDNMNLAMQDIYLKNEDYIAPTNDHETMNKCLQQSSNNVTVAVRTPHISEQQPEAIVVDFSKNKSLIEHNKKNMYDSIFNITLHEAKELIRKAKLKRDTPIPPLNLEELDDVTESSITEAISNLGGAREASIYHMNNTKSSQTCMDNESMKPKKNRFKPKITINNCNGTINLRHISSLTINCATEESVSAEVPIKPQSDELDGDDSSARTNVQSASYSRNTPRTKSGSCNVDSVSSASATSASGGSTSISSSSNSSNASSRSQSKKYNSDKNNKHILAFTSTSSVSGTNNAKLNTNTSTSNSVYPYELVDEVDADVTYDFYNRLLNEIKNSIKDQKAKHKIHSENALGIHSSPLADINIAVSSNSHNSERSVPCVTARKSVDSSAASTQTNKRLILRNFENLKIVLESNGDEETLHPVQIEQWLAEIISETDLEPMQNTDILEHSQITSESI